MVGTRSKNFTPIPEEPTEEEQNVDMPDEEETKRSEPVQKEEPKDELKFTFRQPPVQVVMKSGPLDYLVVLMVLCDLYVAYLYLLYLNDK